jgi:hypothetical protein
VSADGIGAVTILESALVQATAAGAGCNRCKGRACPCTTGALFILGSAIQQVLELQQSYARAHKAKP